MTPDRTRLLPQIVAALAIVSMLLPQAVAYAAIAGMPAVHAVIAALVGLSAYAVLGSSRYAVVSVTSSSAAIFASVVAANGAAGGYTLVILTGILFVLAVIFRADFLVTFISRPVLRGFAYALALSVIVRQLPTMMGITVQAGNIPLLVWRLLGSVAHTHLPSLALGVGTWCLWQLLRRAQRRVAWVQPPLLVFVTGLLAAVVWPLQEIGVAGIGAIHMVPLNLQWPRMEWSAWALAANVAPALFMVLFAESWGTVRSIALRRGEVIQPRREMLALGAANMASGLLQGLPVGAGYSASTANESAGGRSKWTGLLAAGLIAGLLWLFRAELERMPLPVMAAMTASILTDNLGLRRLLDSFKLKGDSWLALVTILGVLLMGVMMGMLLSVGLSVLLALRRFASPALSELGHLPGTLDFLDMAHHPEVKRLPGIRIIRPEEPIFFANVDTMFQQVRQRCVDMDLHAVVLSMEQCDDLDSTSVEALCELQQWMRKRGLQLLLAGAKDRPRATLQYASQPPLNEQWSFFWSVDEAVSRALSQQSAIQRAQTQAADD